MAGDFEPCADSDVTPYRGIRKPVGTDAEGGRLPVVVELMLTICCLVLFLAAIRMAANSVSTEHHPAFCDHEPGESCVSVPITWVEFPERRTEPVEIPAGH